MEFEEQISVYFETFPALETKRLRLRSILPADIDVVHGIRNDKRVGAYLNREDPLSMEAAGELLQKTADGYASRNLIAWAGETKDTGEMIGTCGLIRMDLPNRRAELGGEMSVKAWGKFYAKEAVNAILHFGLHDFGLHTITAYTAPENRSARFLLEQFGFEKEAHFKENIFYKGRYYDSVVYTLFKETFRERA